MGKSRWAVLAAALALTLGGCSSLPMPGIFAKPAAPAPAKPAAELPPRPLGLLYTTFQDHAVLQRRKPIPVWGKADAGAQVTVSLAGETASATADATGKWQATLAPLTAGGPYELSAHSSTGAAETVKDVMLGDVYLCSGQSNMEWPVRMAMAGGSEVAGATNTNIRLFTVHRFASPAARDTFGTNASWAATSPDAVKDFSAVCYFFGRELQPKAGVPLGLVYSVWGGSNLQTWLSRDEVTALGGYQQALDILSEHIAAPEAAEKKWRAITDAWWLAHDPASPAWRDPAFNDSGWDQIVPTGSWKGWGVAALKNFDGVMWLRKTVTLSAAQAQGAAVLTLGPIDQNDTTWINGAEVGSSEGWNTERVYTVPAGTLHEGKNVIAVGVLGGDGMWGPATARSLKLADGTLVALDTAWRYRVSAPMRRTGAMAHAPWLNELGLTMLYNGMIAPLGPTPLSGILWYQGEGNTSDAPHYAPLLAGLIADWRRQFGADTPFLIVQLPGYGPANIVPKESDWADLREAQRQVALATPKTGLAVTIDLGDRRNLHPVVKQETGHRLAVIAQRMIYGQDVVDSGPVAIAAVRTRKTVTVRFDHLAKGFAIYEAGRPIGFQLCDAAWHCRFVDAKAGKDTITLDASQMPGAANVRFCWADSPICNVYNTEDLPAVPFEMPIAAATRVRK